MTMVTPRPDTAGSEFCWRLPKAPGRSLLSGPEHAKAWHRHHGTYDRAGRR